MVFLIEAIYLKEKLNMVKKMYGKALDITTRLHFKLRHVVELYISLEKRF